LTFIIIIILNTLHRHNNDNNTIYLNNLNEQTKVLGQTVFKFYKPLVLNLIESSHLDHFCFLFYLQGEDVLRVALSADFEIRISKTVLS